MKLFRRLPFIPLFAMSDPKEVVTGSRATVPTAVAVEEDVNMPASHLAFGIEVSSTKVYNNKEDKHHDAVQIKISPGLFIKDLSSWMKEYQVGKTLREWAKKVQWREQVWQPLKDWHKSVDWKQVRSEIKEGMDEVDWKQARSEIKEGLDEVDWKQVRSEIKEGMAEVDWKDVKSQVKEATQDLDLQGALHEVKDSMKEVDWNQVHYEMKEVKKTINWDEMKKDFSQGTDLLNEMKESIAHDVDWDDVTGQFKEVFSHKPDPPDEK